MKLLFLHNQYLIGGGEDVSTRLEIELLQSNGHQVDSIVVSNIELSEKNNFRIATDSIWSGHFYAAVAKKIAENKYDIIHVQNFFPQISPSVFYAARRNGTKIVMSVRNYRLVCPNAMLFVNNHICTECVGRTIPFPALKHNCYRNSLSATTVTVAMLSIHNLLNTWTTKIDGYIAISTFVKDQLISGGIGHEKIFVRYNFANQIPTISDKHQSHFLYVGRLSMEKGIDILLAAFNSPELANENLRIIGTGPLLNKVKEAMQVNPNISYMGTLPLDETYREMALAKCLIFPSQWHEPFGRTIIEAFAMGTPVVGSDRGAIPELVIDNYNGFIFKANSLPDLIAVLIKFLDSYNSIDFDQNARKSFLEKFTTTSSYSAIMNIYNKVMNNKICF